MVKTKQAKSDNKNIKIIKLAHKFFLANRYHLLSTQISCIQWVLFTVAFAQVWKFETQTLFTMRLWLVIAVVLVVIQCQKG